MSQNSGDFVSQESKELFKKENLQRMKKKIVVMSNKGGVGKSTVAVNLAAAFADKGHKTAILDTDIHGPSVSKLLGIEGRRIEADDQGRPAPVMIKENFFALSPAMFLETADTPVIWRGPMKMKMISQFIEDIAWPELDYLIIDSPPGTGDEPLSVIQLFGTIDYAVIVTTPQDIALLDVRKGLNFLKQMGIKKTGMVENMAAFKCPHCGETIEVFKAGGVEKTVKEFGAQFLGKIPLDPEIAGASDAGRTVTQNVKTAFSQKIMEMTEVIKKAV